MYKMSKQDRILSMYTALMEGDTLTKSALTAKFGVDERTVQRDIDDIRAFLSNKTLDTGSEKTVIYDRKQSCYRLKDADRELLTNSELLAVCKILLESRSLVKAEMMTIIDKLLKRCISQKNQKAVKTLIQNEKFHYIEPHHGVPLVDKLWSLGNAIRENRIIEVEYFRLKGKKVVRRRLKPVGIMVSEFYFYLLVFIDNINKDEHFENPDDLSPTIYRIDRFQDIKITDDRFHVPYSDRFEEGEFRKRVQFMYGGKLQTVRFTYSGLSIESVFDRLPTAKILNEENGVYTVEAEVFGKGIDMWLRSQGEYVKVLDE